MPLVLNDMMGMEVDRRQRRVHVKDVKNAMMGHIKDGYKVRPQEKKNQSVIFTFYFGGKSNRACG